MKTVPVANIDVPFGHCGACKWWQIVDYVTLLGRCHRHAPVTFQHGKGAAEPKSETWWPSVDLLDFCGDWDEGPSPSVHAMNKYGGAVAEPTASPAEASETGAIWPKFEDQDLKA
mgnify:CR=1 FL=1